MPKIAFYKFLAFYIVTYDLRERLHLHVIKSKRGHASSAKIWLEPVEVETTGNLNEKELNLAVKLVERNQKEIIEKIRNFAKGKKSKPIQLKLK